MALRVAALLAAGGGTRFVGKSHKLASTLNGRPLWEWAMNAIRDAGFDRIVVVTGAVALDLPEDVIEVHNPRWADGQATSLQCAVASARDAQAAFVTVGLADQPHIPASAWRSVTDAPSTFPIVVATYHDVPGPHPVRLGHDIWPLLPREGDEGARRVIRAHPDLVHHVACDGSATDIDTATDLDELRGVAALLGREPEGDFEVVVRDEDGQPLVLRNAPLLRNGRPMPTLYWLAGAKSVREVSRLEARGGVRTAEAEVDPAALAAAHARYAAERDARLPVNYNGPRPSGGVAGTRQGVKCLHAHFAYHLAGGDDPVGRWVAARLEHEQ